MSRLGDRIRGARLEKGITPKALGRKCGLSESFVLEAESGNRIISDIQAQQLLKALGITEMNSNELDVAAEAPAARPPQQSYRYEVPDSPDSSERMDAIIASIGSRTAARKPQPKKPEQQGPADAWLDALGGVVKRVPVMDAAGMVVEHRLLPVIGGKIEGGAPDKVVYYQVPDDKMRGFRLQPGDLLLCVPVTAVGEGGIMLIEYKGVRVARMVRKLEGNRLMLQAFDRELAEQTVDKKDIVVIGKCVRMEAKL